MFERKLFCGLLIDKKFDEALSSIDSRRLPGFFQGKDHLREEIYCEERYLGKEVECPVDFLALELLELNVYSHLKQVVPHFAYEKTPLWFFPVIHPTTTEFEETSLGR